MSELFPMQPVVVTKNGVIRFKENRIVRDLLDFATPLGFDMNEIAIKDYTAEERMQFAQLIGYSVYGYGTLSYVTDESYYAAEDAANKLTEDKGA